MVGLSSLSTRRSARWIDARHGDHDGRVTHTVDRTDRHSPTVFAEATWHPVTRIAFRFCFSYFFLFCLWFAQITFVFTGITGQWLPDRAVIWQMTLIDPITGWVGRHVFGIDAVLHQDSGSGDQAAIWVMVLCSLVVAGVATAIWTVLDRRRVAYARLHAWFLAFLRLCLGGQMLFYGVAKVIPTQMPAPPLQALLRPYGELSPASVLWLQVGSSHPYEIMLGAVEVLGGMLLFLPRTATLGALVSLVSMAQVFLLNMTYDVPVKLLSFHLLMISVVLLTPQMRRLTNVLVLQSPSEPAVQPPLFSAARANRVAAWVQVGLGVWALIGCLAIGWHDWHEYGAGRQKPPLYGIWSVTEYAVDGKPLLPLTTDQKRWQRLVFDEPNVLTYQRMNGDLVTASATVEDHAVAVPELGATFTVQRPTQDWLRLDGHLEGRRVTMSLQQVDLAGFTLLSRGFRWMQDYPYFR